jgi:hypothetical protein
VNGAPWEPPGAPLAPAISSGGAAAAAKIDPAHLSHARRVADAILYEGYLLYPYRGDAQKNQARFQFGVLMPPAYRGVDATEVSASQTECLLECPDDAQVQVTVRFLQLQRRSTETISVGSVVGGSEPTTEPWDEAIEREEEVAAPVAALLAGRRETTFYVNGGQAWQARTGPDGNVERWAVRQWSPLQGRIVLDAQRVAGPYRALRLRVRVENHSQPGGRMLGRQDGLRRALIAAHLLIAVPGARFISMVDPPEWAAAEVAACVNTGTWPVLAGPEDCHDLVLSSPVILYDHPEVAAESAGDLYDATEIDEILTLRTMALTDAEKRQARTTDPRAAAIIDRVGDMPAEMLERMHGAIRYLRAVPGAAESSGDPGTALPGSQGAATAADPQVPWWDPGADTSVSPETDHVIVDGVRVARGSRVLMRPGSRRADAQDLFLVGREAVVEAVLHDVDGHLHLAVTPAGDPAADLNRQHGRFLYFAPDEVEPIGSRQQEEEAR